MTIGPTMACPKCGGHMHSYERSRIVIDQCEDCRGFFLDGGELERLIDAEGGGWSGSVGPPAELPTHRVMPAASACAGARARRRPPAR